jgi:hypothetical protein
MQRALYIGIISVICCGSILIGYFLTIRSMPRVEEARLRAGGKAGDDRELHRKVWAAVVATVPAGATVAVVSKGNDNLLAFPGRKGWHFPQQQDRRYLGYNPEKDQAIAHLEALRAKGGEYLVFPETAFWWLEYYQEFKQHLDSHYQRVHDDRHCIIYRLAERKSASENPAPETGEGVLEDVSGDGISGWAWDSKQPDRPIRVDIFDGDTKLATVLACAFREDLLQAQIGSGRHAFGYAIPAGLKDGKSHPIRVTIAGTDKELTGSPKVLVSP